MIECHDNLVHILVFWNDAIVVILVDSYIDGDWETLYPCDISREKDQNGAQI